MSHVKIGQLLDRIQYFDIKSIFCDINLYICKFSSFYIIGQSAKLYNDITWKNGCPASTLQVYTTLLVKNKADISAAKWCKPSPSMPKIIFNGILLPAEETAGFDFVIPNKLGGFSSLRMILPNVLEIQM